MRGLWRGIFIGRDVDVKHQGVIGGLKANFPPKKKLKWKIFTKIQVNMKKTMFQWKYF